jgi:hypothetical protein
MYAVENNESIWEGKAIRKTPYNDRFLVKQ